MQTLQTMCKALVQVFEPVDAALRGQIELAKAVRAELPLQTRVWRSDLAALPQHPPRPQRLYTYRVADPSTATIMDTVHLDLAGNYKSRELLGRAVAAQAPITERFVELRVTGGWRGVVEVASNASSAGCLHIEVLNDVDTEARLDGAIAGMEMDADLAGLLAGKAPPPRQPAMR